MADVEKSNDHEWALQRRLEDVFAKLGEKFGDLTGRLETQIKPTVTFDDIGRRAQGTRPRSLRLRRQHGVAFELPDATGPQARARDLPRGGRLPADEGA